MSDFKSQYDDAYVQRLAATIGADSAWTQNVLDGFDRLEMKARTKRLSEHVFSHLGGFDACADLLDGLVREDEWAGFNAWPLVTIVEDYGLTDFDRSMSLLQAWTQVFTGEFAIRTFLESDFERSLNFLRDWTHHDSDHVRRLVSEGTRPRLPWGRKIKAIDANPEVLLELICPLRDDASEYVRRSVANHLNDWTKTHAFLVLGRLSGWGESDSEVWVRKHALRSLVKQGVPEAIELLGFRGNVVCESLDVPDTLVFPGILEIEVTLKNPTKEHAHVVVDYGICHQGAHGIRPAKVFKWKKLSLAPGESMTLRRSHTIKPITTRRFYNGTHQLRVQCNGVMVAEVTFELEGV